MIDNTANIWRDLCGNGDGRARQRATTSEIVLVTANIGAIDTPLALPPHHGIDAVYFADFDVPGDVANTWETVVRVHSPAVGTERLIAKYPKSQILNLPETRGYRYIAWADACFRFRTLSFLHDAAAAIGDNQSRAVFIPHPDRQTVSEEYEFVLGKVARGNRYLSSRYDPEPLRRERAFFSERFDLARLPLWCGGLWMIPDSPAARSFCDAWWETIKQFSIMDQPSITPLLMSAGIEVAALDVPLYHNSMWERLPHE